jgi:uncharacterized membrane protein YozB (DUF420 family)
VIVEALSEFVRTLVVLDVIAIAIVFAIGMVVAPLIMLMQSASRWNQRLKRTAVSLVTSWFGLWLYWHRPASEGAVPSNRAPSASR